MCSPRTAVPARCALELLVSRFFEWRSDVKLWDARAQRQPRPQLVGRKTQALAAHTEGRKSASEPTGPRHVGRGGTADERKDHSFLEHAPWNKGEKGQRPCGSDVKTEVVTPEASFSFSTSLPDRSRRSASHRDDSCHSCSLRAANIYSGMREIMERYSACCSCRAGMLQADHQ